MYNAIVNEEERFTLDFRDGHFELDGKIIDWDIAQTGHRAYHVLWNNQSFRAGIIHIDPVEKIFTLRINGHDFTVSLKDRYDRLLEKLNMQKNGSQKATDIKAPMPGLVKDLLVKEGQQLKAGDSLLVLEAMKMENILKAETAAMIKEICVRAGDAVEKNQLLIKME